MMDELEQKLSSARLSAPAAGFDRRMEEVFAAALRTAEPSRRTSFWWWLAAMGAAGGMTALLVVPPNLSRAEAETIVYRLEPEGRMRDILFGPAAKRDALQPLVLRGNAP